MAFDQLGVWIKKQYDEFEKFIRIVYEDAQAMSDHLEVQIVRINYLISKLQEVDDMLGDTSMRGNPGGASKRRDEPTLVGGDLTWEYDPIFESTPEISEVYDDYSVVNKIDPIKKLFYGSINRRRQKLENKLKKLFFVREKYMQEMYFLKFFVEDQDLKDRLQEIRSQFLLVQKAAQVTSREIPEEETVNQTSADLVKKVGEFSGLATLFPDTFETRFWPIRDLEEYMNIQAEALSEVFRKMGV